MKILKAAGRKSAPLRRYHKLLQSPGTREEHGQFVLEGLRLCIDALESGVTIEQLFCTDNALQKYDTKLRPLLQAAGEIYEISEDGSHYISDTQNPQGIYCLCKMLDKWTNFNKIDLNGKYILLENVADPANLGAISRTAEALGLTGLIVFGGCDRYNPKALRASMGSLLRIPILEVDDAGLYLRQQQKAGFKTYAAVLDLEATPLSELSMEGGVILAIGNEGSGLTQETVDSASVRVTIPMAGRTESLNAAMAAGIFMWEMRRGTGAIQPESPEEPLRADAPPAEPPAAAEEPALLFMPNPRPEDAAAEAAPEPVGVRESWRTPSKG